MTICLTICIATINSYHYNIWFKISRKTKVNCLASHRLKSACTSAYRWVVSNSTVTQSGLPVSLICMKRRRAASGSVAASCSWSRSAWRCCSCHLFCCSRSSWRFFSDSYTMYFININTFSFGFSGFPRGQCQPVIWHNFGRKLYESEMNWTEGTFLAPPESTTDFCLKALNEIISWYLMPCLSMEPLSDIWLDLNKIYIPLPFVFVPGITHTEAIHQFLIQWNPHQDWTETKLYLMERNRIDLSSTEKIIPCYH